MSTTTHLSYDSIIGRIYPKPQNGPCRLERPTQPVLFCEKQVYPLEDLQGALDHYEEYTNRLKTDPTFWNLKLILYVLNAPSIISMSVIPCDGTEKASLFIQKGEMVDGRVGFFAPYLLSRQEQEKWKAEPQLPNPYKIHNDETIEQSLAGVDEENCVDLRDCLECFLIDRSTIAVALTYKTPAGDISSRCWLKV